ncbi:MAG TPA: OmpA family protein [bacterium]|nr:OmpA family protein [bacterium]HPN30914.1 OmpA family protein [bacterium]
MKKILFALLIAAGVLSSALSAADNGSYVIGPYLGYHEFMNRTDYKDKVEFGAKFEKNISGPWSYEIGAGYIPTKVKSTGSKKSCFLGGINGVYNFNLSNSTITPYLAAGVSSVFGSVKDMSGIDGALGLKYRINEDLILKPEIKYIRFFKSNRDDFIVSAMLGFVFGKKTVAANEVIEKKVETIIQPEIKKFENAKYDVSGNLESVTLKINFATAKSDIQDEYMNEIKNFAEFLKKNENLKVEIQGHTDNVGETEYNKTLSESRANSVREILISKYNIAEGRITAKGYGPEFPVASNETEEGRLKNRRIEAVIVK